MWEYAVERGFVVVSKDEDFDQTALLHGPPPKVVWIRLGNGSTDDIERTIRNAKDELDEFARNEVGAFLVVG